MPTSTTELLKTELGKAFLEAKQKDDRAKMFYKKNEIGEDVVIQWNPYKKLDENPYAIVVANAFDEMIKKTIPQDAVLSTSFQNWINRTKNELIVDSKIARDDYFKGQTNFETGEYTENKGNDLLKAKMDYLEMTLSRFEKAFTTHMEKNADKAFSQEYGRKDNKVLLPSNAQHSLSSSTNTRTESKERNDNRELRWIIGSDTGMSRE